MFNFANVSFKGKVISLNKVSPNERVIISPMMKLNYFLKHVFNFKLQLQIIVDCTVSCNRVNGVSKSGYNQLLQRKLTDTFRAFSVAQLLCVKV